MNQALGHESEKTDDHRFTVVTRSSGAGGWTTSPRGAANVKQPDILPPDEEDLRRAEEQDR